MPNLRILHDNALSRTATLTANTTSGSLVAANMQTEVKTAVHRTTGTTAAYTMTWTNLESIGGVALPATNLTSSATIRVRLYSDTVGTTQIADSGTISACPSNALGLHGWTGAINANAFPYGGASKVAVWFSTHYNARRCVIDVVDTTNPAGYIDCARVVVGPYWEAPVNAKYGVTSSPVDMSSTSRSESGDQFTRRGAMYETLSLSLQELPEASRSTLLKILRSVGSYRNIFVSLLPGAGAQVEQDYMIYGKRSSSPISYDFFNTFSNQLEIEGW